MKNYVYLFKSILQAKNNTDVNFLVRDVILDKYDTIFIENRNHTHHR